MGALAKANQELVLASVLRRNAAPLEFPRVFSELLQPHLFKAFYGGRGSAKSESFARALITMVVNTRRPLRILCCREIQNSMRESVYALLCDIIKKADLTAPDGTPFFRILETEIRGWNGSVFLFIGLRSNPQSMKSAFAIDIAWVEEASAISARSLELLYPTMRGPKSEIWFSWNPDKNTDPVDQMFRGSVLPPRSVVRRVSWRDNPYFPRVLREMKDYDLARDIDRYNHIWEGEYRAYSQARVFTNVRFERCPDPPDGTQLYFGADWGYSVDPSVLVRSWISGRTIFVDREAWGVNVEIDHLPALFAGTDPRGRWPNPRPWVPGKEPRDCWIGVPGATTWTIRADSARPDTISYMRNRGFDIVAATKGAGSVEDGIEFLKSFDIVVDPYWCPHTCDEMRTYSWKTDPKNPSIVFPVLEDKNNHNIDSLRYSHEGTRRGLSGSGSVGGLH